MDFIFIDIYWIKTKDDNHIHQPGEINNNRHLKILGRERVQDLNARF